MRFLLKTVWASSLCAYGVASHAAELDAASSRRAVQAYCHAISAAMSLEDLEGHWSAALKREQGRLRAQQLDALEPGMRLVYEKTMMVMLKDMARQMPQQMQIACTAKRCTAVAQISPQWKQVFVLVREGGAVVIDEMHAHFGVERAAR